MKWMYSLKQKTTAALILSLVIVLTLLTNFFDQRNYKKLEASFTSIYEDRLLAESYLFNLYDNLKKKQDIFQVSGYEEFNEKSIESKLAPLNNELDDIIVLYEDTYLTLEEDIQFYKFKELNVHLKEVENQLALPENNENYELRSKHNRMTEQAFAALATLSEIQTSEGKVIKTDFDKNILTGISNSRFEITILIVIGLIIIGLIFSSRSMQIKEQGNATLN